MFLISNVECAMRLFQNLYKFRAKGKPSAILAQ